WFLSRRSSLWRPRPAPSSRRPFPPPPNVDPLDPRDDLPFPKSHRPFREFSDLCQTLRVPNLQAAFSFPRAPLCRRRRKCRAVGGGALSVFRLWIQACAGLISSALGS